MVEHVKLSATDLDVLIDITQKFVDYKFRALSRTNWNTFEKDYLPPLIGYFKQNQFKVVTASDNIFVWIIDQIVWSRVVLDGVPRRDWIPLADTDLGARALAICRSASRGQEAYDRRDATTFNSLFDRCDSSSTK